ncbi:MAG TPA: allantoinase AllB [Candidatus Limnocylindria bacterium]|nr:allantoinase AllB [Candidatus Limnocylindria bacterium]
MADLGIRGGRVVLADEVRAADVLVLAGSIVRIADPGEGGADEEIDARGQVVLPGVVDAHVHVNEPGRADWEGWLAATRGAARGGVTTIADMPLNSIPPTTDEAAFEAKAAAAAASAVVDYALWGGLVRADESALRALAGRGVVGVKAFLCPSGVDEFPHLDDGELVPALRAAAAAGQLVAAHCEDERTLALAERSAGGRGDAHGWLASRPVEAEVVAIERLARSAREAGARVHVVHVSSADGLAAVRRARRDGVDISAETCPHYLAFGAGDVARLGPVLKCAPPIRHGARGGLWEEVVADRVDYVASDHSPCARSLKEPRDGRFASAWGGVSGIQSTLAVMLSGVRERGLSLPSLAQLLATRPAKRLGLWPRKGEIRVGADADLVLVDLEREWTLGPDELETRSGLSPYLGRAFRGAVVRTLVRGRTVYADGAVLGAPGDGWFVRSLV